MVDDYHEIDVSRILPFWKNGLLGVHMVNIMDNMFIYDFTYCKQKFFH